ncbi:MAG: VanZ family protein [Abditibacteriota bacterium]|nr:VanZ family protein [Abditibacteriota bacterium]
MLKLFKFFSISMLVVWALVIFCFSAQDAKDSKDLSRGFTHKLLCVVSPYYRSLSRAGQEKVLVKVGEGIRKTAHFANYTILGFISCVAAFSFLLKKPFRLTGPALLCFLYAVSDEIHQIFVPGRSGEFRDVLIDTAGGLTGILIAFTAAVLLRAVRKR